MKQRSGQPNREFPKEGAPLLALNLGDDADDPDTTGAVYGQLARVYYGETGIPHEWLE